MKIVNKFFIGEKQWFPSRESKIMLILWTKLAVKSGGSRQRAFSGSSEYTVA